MIVYWWICLPIDYARFKRDTDDERVTWEDQEREKRETHSRKKRSISIEKNLEAMVVVDKAMMNYYKNEDVTTYVLTIMNMVSTYWPKWHTTIQHHYSFKVSLKNASLFLVPSGKATIRNMNLYLSIKTQKCYTPLQKGQKIKQQKPINHKKCLSDATYWIIWSKRSSCPLSILPYKVVVLTSRSY